MLVYPVSCRTALESVVCVRISETRVVLASKPTVACFGEAHAAAGVLGYLTLVLFCVGFPACLFWLLQCSDKFDRSVLEDFKNKATNEAKENANWTSSSASASADTDAEDPPSATVFEAVVNPMFDARGNAPRFPEKRLSNEGKAGDRRKKTKKTSTSSDNPRAASVPAYVFAFVRQRKEIQAAFKPLVLGDFNITFLAFRPAYLCVIFAASVGNHVFPPSSTYAAHRCFVTMAVIILYYSALVWLRPLRRSRLWTLPVQLSLLIASVLALSLIGFIEVSDLELEANESIVEALSLVAVICVVVIIAVVIPVAAVYELVEGAKRDIRMDKLRSAMKRKCLSPHMSQKKLKVTLSVADMLQDLGVDGEEYAEVMSSLRINESVVEQDEDVKEDTSVEMVAAAVSDPINLLVVQAKSSEVSKTSRHGSSRKKKRGKKKLPPAPKRRAMILRKISDGGGNDSNSGSGSSSSSSSSRDDSSGDSSDSSSDGSSSNGDIEDSVAAFISDHEEEWRVIFRKTGKIPSDMKAFFRCNGLKKAMAMKVLKEKTRLNLSASKSFRFYSEHQNTF
jgi:hypothetical protein